MVARVSMEIQETWTNTSIAIYPEMLLISYSKIQQLNNNLLSLDPISN